MNVVTVKIGSKYSSDYVNALYDSIYSSNFYCYTDDSEGLNPNIKVIEPIEELDGVWNKLALFSLDLGKVIYLDLDVVIQGDIESIYNVDTFTMVKCYWKPLDQLYDGWMNNMDHNINSSVMVWNGLENIDIWNKFMEDPEYYMTKYHGIDHFIFHEGFTSDFWEQGKIYSRLYGINEDSWHNPQKEYFLTGAEICLMNGQTTKKDYIRLANDINK